MKEQAAAPAGAVDFFKQVQPILEAKCFGCHTGGKAKGGLRLDDRAAALDGRQERRPRGRARQAGRRARCSRA